MGVPVRGPTVKRDTVEDTETHGKDAVFLALERKTGHRCGQNCKGWQQASHESRRVMEQANRGFRAMLLGGGFVSPCHHMQRAGVKRLVSLFLLVTAACGNPGISGFFSPVAYLPPVSPPFESETWIVSGQSNAVGCGLGASLDISPSVEMWNGAGWQPAHEPLAFMEPFAGCHVGPWVAAANALNRPVKLTGWVEWACRSALGKMVQRRGNVWNRSSPFPGTAPRGSCGFRARPTL